MSAPFHWHAPHVRNNSMCDSVLRYYGSATPQDSTPVHKNKARKRRQSIQGRTTTEQLLPSKEGNKYAGHSVLFKETFAEDINSRVMLLAPWPGDAPPFMKSIIDLYSQSGSIVAEVSRLPGAGAHFFQLHVTSCEAGTQVTLPADFRGAIEINNGAHQVGGVKCSQNIDDRIEAGLVRFNTGESTEGEDEVHVQALGEIEIKLQDEADVGPAHRPTWTIRESGLNRLRRILKIP
ncbi:hypothetical protein BD779DRAFT_1669187 [Infundibulicybe gibba]|nr:hypothetical protein BD779DRAFT_1669187 [Infundibulicybe gibba]